MADCGMGVAVDIRVIREHVLRFLSARWRGGYMTKARLLRRRLGTIGLPGRGGRSAQNVG